MMTSEPVRLIGLLNSAVAATLGLLLFTGVDPDLIGALVVVAAAWIAVAAELVRRRVTPWTPDSLEG